MPKKRAPYKHTGGFVAMTCTIRVRIPDDEGLRWGEAAILAGLRAGFTDPALDARLVADVLVRHRTEAEQARYDKAAETRRAKSARETFGTPEYRAAQSAAAPSPVAGTHTGD